MHDDPYFAREAEKYSDPIPSREFILNHLEKRRTPANREIIAAELGLESEVQQEALRRRLRAMERDGQLVFTRRKFYALPELLEMVRGSVIGHKDGYGFLRVAGYREDLFLSAEQMRAALHGDVVLAQALMPDHRNRREARIVRVLEPRSELIVGRYFTESGLGFVVPDDLRLGFDIVIPPDESQGARMGQVVLAALKQRPTARMQAVGSVVEILGDQLTPGVETEMAIRNHNLPHTWSEEVLLQVFSLEDQLSEDELQDRRDLRQLPFVTIDGEDARDFDDALYCERKLGGWCLFVAIADVSAYVQPDTPLDCEARNRGNSVYFPTKVIPMLPEELSNGLCSINPQVDRLTMVCEMVISDQGRMVDAKFSKALITSQARLTYNKVARILDGEKELGERYHHLVPHIKTLHRLFLTLKKGRELRGGIEFETQETQFIFNDQRRIEQIVPLIRNDAHKMVEECMIMANVAAARLAQKHNLPVLYRVHDAPNEDRLNSFRLFLQELGLSFAKSGKTTPKHYADLMLHIGDRPDRELIQTMLLRSMQPAVYSPEDRGHFGLALGTYSHFTSPIRRYPDLILHRAIKELLARQRSGLPIPPAEPAMTNEIKVALVALGEICSITERRADEATREVADWLKCEFMQDHVGQPFRGVISGVTSFGFFVRLDQLSIDGLVHVSSLDNDYYQFDAVSQRLVGRTLGCSYQLGDVVQVKVVAVHLDERKIELALEASERRAKRDKGAVDKNGTTRKRKRGNRPHAGIASAVKAEEQLPAAKRFRGHKKGLSSTADHQSSEG